MGGLHLALTKTNRIGDPHYTFSVATYIYNMLHLNCTCGLTYANVENDIILVSFLISIKSHSVGFSI